MLQRIKSRLLHLAPVHWLYRSLIFRHTAHYYSPLTDLRDVRSRQDAIFADRAEFDSSVNLRADEQLRLLEQLAPFLGDFNYGTADRAGRYHPDQDFFRIGDAMILAGILRHLKPRQVIEIGSGFSSALMLDVDEQHLGEQSRFTFIDPFPARLLSVMTARDAQRCSTLRQRIQNVPTSLFSTLSAGDLLFVDSSHVTKTGSDVNHIFFEILPRLAEGVWVHFHDVFWPMEYPKSWVLGGRCWNEAYLLHAFLQYNSRFQIMLFNSFLGARHRDWFERHSPAFLQDTGGSIYLRKTAGSD